jgi:glyoxylase-like metal-dependent hydrolase (beta-lactamase superfamily II)
VDVVRVGPDLWRWTARHPAWRGGPPDSAADWPPEVGCVAFRGPDALVLVDPLVPADGWPQLDALVDGAGLPVHVLLTIEWHKRSSHEARARYSAASGAPAGVEPLPIARARETLWWLDDARTLIAGDLLIGFGGSGPLRVCPQAWLDDLETGIRREETLAALQPLLDLPVDRVLVSHGEPVLERGHDALAAALSDHAPSAA